MQIGQEHKYKHNVYAFFHQNSRPAEVKDSDNEEMVSLIKKRTHKQPLLVVMPTKASSFYELNTLG